MQKNRCFTLFSPLFQQLPVTVIGTFQYAHLLDGYSVEFDKTLSLWYTLLNEYGVKVFHVREADKLVYSRIIADIAF